MALPMNLSTVFNVLSQSTLLIQSITKDSRTPPTTVVPIPRIHGFFINFFIHFTSFQSFTQRQEFFQFSNDALLLGKGRERKNYTPQRF